MRAARGVEHNISVCFTQVKDAFNQGLVFTGPKLGYQFGINWRSEKYTFSYTPSVNLGIPFSHEMIAVSLGFVPIDVKGTRPLSQMNGHTLDGGIGFKTNYNYQIYPNLQSGHLFWMTEIGLSAAFAYKYEWERRRISLSVRNSLLGFVSKKQYDDPYFYSLKFRDFITFAHQDLKFGSFNRYNHTEIGVEFAPDVDKRHAFRLGVDYLATYFGIGFKQLDFVLTWKISL